MLVTGVDHASAAGQPVMFSVLDEKKLEHRRLVLAYDEALPLLKAYDFCPTSPMTATYEARIYVKPRRLPGPGE